MKKFIQNIVVVLLMFLGIGFLNAQDGRDLIRGKVLYKGINVPDHNVINSTTQEATITNNYGEFALLVKEGDELVFTAVNYQLKLILVTKEDLANNRINVEVDEKVTKLDEVTVGPENQKEFLRIQNERLKDFDYEVDRGTAVRNIADRQVGIQGGVDFARIFKSLVKPKPRVEGERVVIKPSEIIPNLFSAQFFLEDLHLKEDEVIPFLYYVDQILTSKTLLKKENEFELIEFLVSHSMTFLDAKDDR